MQNDSSQKPIKSYTSIQSTGNILPDLDEDTRRRLEELDEYILLLERERW